MIDDFGNESCVHIGLEYKHLGNRKDAKVSRSKEIGFRIAEAASAINELCRSTRTAHVDPPKHWNLAVYLCVSRLAYDAHTESKWTSAQMPQLSSAYNGFARRSVSKAFFVDDNRRSADAALAVCSALPFELHLRLI